MTGGVPPLGAQVADSAPPPRRGILPVAGYSEQTGAQFGATAFRFYRTGPTRLTRPSSTTAYFARTAREHTKALMQIERWSADNLRRTHARVEYLSYPLPYFGIGGDTPNANEEWYSAGVTRIHLLHQVAKQSGSFALLAYRYTRSAVREWDVGGLVAQDGHTRAAAVTSQLELGLVRDSRDDLAAPQRGTYARVMMSVHPRRGVLGDLLQGNAPFNRFMVDARRYHRTGIHAVAWQLQYDGLIDGLPPFDQLPQIGSDTALRGYARGRFRDRHATTGQVELRTAYWRRVGLVAFTGAGAVAPDFKDLLHARWHPSAGTGLRYRLTRQERSTARIDLGFGRRSIALSLGFNEAF